MIAAPDLYIRAMMYLNFYLMLVSLDAVSLAYSQTNYTSFAESALQTLQENYNTTSGLWDTCGWWNGANCLTVIADLAAIDKNVLATATSVFASTYTLAPPQNPSANIFKVSAPGYVRTFYEKPPFNATNSRRDLESCEDSLEALEDRDNPLDGDNDLEIFEPRATMGGNAPGFLDSCYDDNSWWALAWMAAYDLTNNTDYLDTAIGIFGNLTAAWPTNCSNGGIYW